MTAKSMVRMCITMTYTNRPFLLIGLLATGVLSQNTPGTFNQRDFQEKGAFGTWGDMIDITNDESIQTAIKAYDTKKEVESVKSAIDAYKAADAAQNASPTGIATSAAKDQLFKYKSSVIGTSSWINNTLKKVQNVLDNVSDRVNRWRTTLPMLRSYSETAGNFLENSYEYLGSFEISDLWDLDQTFFRGMEDRVRYGKGLGLSFAFYILRRKDGFGRLGHMFDAFYGSNSEIPFNSVYTTYSLARPEIKDLKNEDRVGMLVVFEGKVGMDRLDLLSKGEYVCDPSDPELDCNCPEGATCKPSTRRELDMSKVVAGLKNPRITTEEIDKLGQTIEERRLQLAAKRKVVQEIKARMQVKFNDVLAYSKAMQGQSQNVACLSQKALLFDKDHSTSPKYQANTCDDVATFKGKQMTLVPSLSESIF